MQARNSKHRAVLFFATMAACLTMACTNSDIDEVTNSTQPPSNIAADTTLHHARLRMAGTVQPFDADVQTRADEWQWPDGSVIYLQYHVGSSLVRGHAVYTKSTDTWDAYYNGTLGTNGQCEVYFFEGASTNDKKSVTLTGGEAVYTDVSGYYSVEGSDIVLGTTLTPATGRIRFHRGTNETGISITVSGMTYYTGYNAETNTLSTTDASDSLTVGSTGYTPYVYCNFTDATTRQLTVTNSIDGERLLFTKQFDANVLQKGHSGYITIPTEDTNRGWTVKVVDIHEGHTCVDLGLPSGLFWANTNVGATTPEAYGNYYAWGETETKTDYGWSTYTLCNGSSSTMKKYCTSSDYGSVDNKTQLELSDDAARVNWGGKWRMPTINEWEELNSKCTWTWTTQNGNNGYLVTGPNGNTIFLPTAGYLGATSIHSVDTDGDYWSSSLATSSSKDGSVLYFNSSSHRIDNGGRCGGLSVRPVVEL